MAFVILIGGVLAIILFFGVLPAMLSAGIVSVVGSSAKRSGQAATDRSLRQAAVLHAGEFKPDKTFFEGEGGIAFDTTRKLVFVSSRVGRGKERGKIYPLGDVTKYQSWTQTKGRGVQFHFMDLTINDIDTPSWRVGFGRNEHLALQAGATFELLWART